MGKIFKVSHVNLGKEFALKIIHSELSDDRRVLNQFFREARTASLLDHPNIVQITDFGVDGKSGAYIVMELLKGETVHRRLRDGPLPISVALDIALQVADALRYIHGQEVVHCDIKADNIFLCQPGSGGPRPRVLAKLIDFGLSREQAAGAQLAAQEVAGTPAYMAPEQIRGAAPQPSMDIYALGVLLYEMVTGEPVFEGTRRQIVEAQLYEEPPAPSKRLGSEVDVAVERLILKALAKEPDDRQQSMGQLLFEIRTAMEMLGLRPPHGYRATLPPGKRPLNPELAELRTLVDNSYCPLFLLDADARLLQANVAFCNFVRSPFEELVARGVERSRLKGIYPDIKADIDALCRSPEPEPVRRVLELKKREGEAPLQLLICLMPVRGEEGDVEKICGIIHPLEAK